MRERDSVICTERERKRIRRRERERVRESESERDREIGRYLERREKGRK